LSRFLVRYSFPDVGETPPEAMAERLAREQTVEIPPGVAAPEVEALAIGRVEAVGAGRAGRVAATISYPLAAAGDELPQLLNVLLGNASLYDRVRVEAVEWTPELLAPLPGPAFGVDGLRRLCAAADRPLTATALKPMGLAPRDLARRASEAALGGVDLIKDDHGLGDQAWAPFRDRVRAVQGAVERANRASGGSTVYVPNLTGPVDRLEERLEVLAECAVRAAMVAPAILGLDAMRALAERSGLALVAHPALGGALAGAERGFAPEFLFGDLFRLAGADAVVFPNAGGRFPHSLADCRRIEARLSAPLAGRRSAFLMLGGGIDVARLRRFVPEYGVDTIWLVGGSLYARADLRAAVRELAETVAATPARSAGGRP